MTQWMTRLFAPIADTEQSGVLKRAKRAVTYSPQCVSRMVGRACAGSSGQIQTQD